MDNMIIRIKRKRVVDDCTLGDIFIDGVWEGYTLENRPHEEKVQGDTRIDAGIYDVEFREIVSGLTQTYREKYPWFEFHIQIMDVPNFDYVYIHIGNKAKDTDGCVLVGSSQSFSEAFIGSSTTRYKEIYKKISSALKQGIKVTLIIEDEG